MSRRFSATGLGVLVVAIAAAVLVVRCGRPAQVAATAPPAPAPPAEAARAAPPATPPPAPAASAAVEPPAALPGSLEGTEPDGAIRADDAGHLVIDLELRRLFDHFLIASGEEPLAAIRARIVAVLHARLPATAEAEAIAILDRYLAYRDAARQLSPAPADPRAGLAQLHDLRARMFAPEVARAFFADEEAATYAALDRRDALVDPALSPAERERRLAEIDARLPAAVREARAAATAPIDELNREQAMRAAGAGDDQITAARAAAFGTEAAARLAELDHSRASWDARLARFRAARAALLADPQLDDAERSRRIAELLASSFTPQEQIRVEALDRIAAEHAGR
ncbi:MAG TPA: lipase secretion chaperone [Kofleriaceae bacterium]|jgi:lipase chaperone LimK|nr:lipase secretion chaperone [Kofleriaceae bacterium]